MEFEEIVGVGAQATVYRSGKYAVKLFKEGCSKTEVLYEALINSVVENTGLHIPKTYEVLNINNQMAIRMDHIKGSSLSDCILNDVENTEAYLESMVKLQIEMHSKKLLLPFSLKDRLKVRIQGSQILDETLKEKVLALLKELPEGDGLCHGDFHGYNILVCEGEYWIIDWIDATRGCADGDVCRTYMLYSLYAPEWAELYLDLYCKNTGKNRNSILAWLPAVAAARLSENFETEKERLMSWVNSVL